MKTLRSLSCKTAFILWVVLLATGALSAQFGGGSGTVQDPYWIATPQHLDAMRNASSACFILIQDIDLDVAPYNSGSGWAPIGYTSNTDFEEFTGELSGNGYKIMNLYIRAGHYAGLFGLTLGAELRDITLTNVDIMGVNYTGGLVAYSIETNISKCNVSGSVQGGSTVGGLVGDAVSSEIINCFSTASVSAQWMVGGLVGTMYLSSMVENSYAVGLVTSAGGYLTGGLIGELSYGVHTVTSSYWDIQASGQSSSAAGSGRTSAEMTYPYAANTYQGWNFSSTWKADQTNYNGGYPYHYKRVDYPSISFDAVQPGEPVLFSISCSTWGAQIFYTLDNSEPTESSLPYSEAFWVYPDADSTVWVKARAYKDGWVPSAIASVFWNFSSVANPPEENTPPLPVIECYPNPFKENCQIKVMLSHPGRTSLRIYNTRGQFVRTLLSEKWATSKISEIWDGRDLNGREVAAGIYLLCVDGGVTRSIRKIIKTR